MNFDRMRELFLDQAIRGELVSQLAEEGVVEQIGAAPEEVPFKIPESWSWIRVEELAVKRKTIDPSTLTNDEIELWSIPAFDAGVAEKVSPGDIGSSKKVVQVGDVLLAKIVPHIKRVWVVSESANSLIKLASTEWLVYASELFLPEFMGLLFRAPYFRTKMMGSVSGMGSLKRANPRILAKVWLPVPPIKEQERIVTRLEDAFAEIDRAEKAYGELQTLAGVLRGQILQEAIEGKLVPQLAEEGVVEQIGAAPEEVPFEIPEKWKWYYLGSVIEYGKSNQVSGDEITSQTWVLDLEDIEKNTGRILEKKRGVPSTSNKNKFESGYVLYSKLRPYLNKVVVADEAGVCTTEIVPINVIGASVPLDAKYLQTYLMSPFFVNYANQASYGVKMPRLGTKDARAALIPIPPLEEQKRIVQKVVELLSQTDSLAGC